MRNLVSFVRMPYIPDNEACLAPAENQASYFQVEASLTQSGDSGVGREEYWNRKKDLQRRRFGRPRMKSKCWMMIRFWIRSDLKWLWMPILKVSELSFLNRVSILQNAGDRLKSGMNDFLKEIIRLMRSPPVPFDFLRHPRKNRGKADVPSSPITNSSHEQKTEKWSGFFSQNATGHGDWNYARLLTLLRFIARQFHYFGTLFICIKTLKYLFSVWRQTYLGYSLLILGIRFEYFQCALINALDFFSFSYILQCHFWIRGARELFRYDSCPLSTRMLWSPKEGSSGLRPEYEIWHEP